MPIRTWYFAPKTFGQSELSQFLKAAIGRFSVSPEQTHLAINLPLPDGWDVDKDWAIYDDIDAVTDLGVPGLSIRAWFQNHSGEHLYFDISGQKNTTSITASADSMDLAKQLVDVLARELSLEEVRNPHDEFIERMKRLDECPYDFTRIVQDPELAEILALRWKESNHSFEAQAYLSTIILLGSILEGALLDRIQSNPKEANQSASAPKKQGAVLHFDEWTLENLISVSHECNWIDKDVRDFSLVLRDYRNLVHPRQQKKLAIRPDAGTCKVAREVVGAALEDLAK